MASRPVRRILYRVVPVMAIPLGRRLPVGSSGLPEGRAGGQPIPSARPCSRWGLPSRRGRPRRWCALTAPFHPCLCGPEAAIGGLFSVALSCGSPRLGVTQHLALWSPDVPRPGHSRARTRPPGRLTTTPILAAPADGRVPDLHVFAARSTPRRRGPIVPGTGAGGAGRTGRVLG